MKRFQRTFYAVDPKQPADSLLERAVSPAQNNQAALASSVFAVRHVRYAWKAFGESAMCSAFIHRPDADVINYIEKVRQHGLFSDRIKSRYEETFHYLMPKSHLVKGQAQKEIPWQSKSLEADLVVISTVAGPEFASLFSGNTAEAILEQVESSVLAIKPEGFETAVSLAAHGINASLAGLDRLSTNGSARTLCEPVG